jgi:predicted small integral membrane protein
MNASIFKMLKLSDVNRISKGVIAMCVGVFGTLVATGNIIDFETNYQFVQHVLSMDDFEPWFQGADIIGWRAITSPELHFIFYSMIILGELLTGVFSITAGVIMITNKNALNLGKALFFIGGTFGILVWYLGFSVVGAEWFSMWASKWNAQMKAYAFSSFILLAMIYVATPDLKDD